jgi:hypothetical protein
MGPLQVRSKASASPRSSRVSSEGIDTTASESDSVIQLVKLLSNPGVVVVLARATWLLGDLS